MIKRNSRLVQRITVGLGLTASILLQVPAAFAGSLVLTGGSWAFPGSGGIEEDYGTSIYEEIVDLAGGLDSAKIGIISTASSNPERSANFYLEDFDILYGDAADVEWIPITRDTCDGFKNDADSAIAAQIRDRNSFIFTGGDQSFITDCFFNEDPVAQTRSDTALIEALREQFDAGAVIAGTSAGTAVQPVDPMITNGATYEALRDGPVSFIGSPPFDNTLYYNPLGGLGFFEYGLIDSHFSERGRQGRIIRLASDLGVETTYGVDENTALVVTDAGTPEVSFEVLGQGGVFITDLAEAEVGEKDGFWTIQGVEATYLTEGDQFDPLTKTASFGDKSPVVEQSASLPVTENIFSYFDDDLGDWTDQRAFTETAIALFDSTADTAFGKSFEADPTYGVELTKTSASQGFSGLDSQGITKVSFENLTIDIAPVPEPGAVLGLFTLGAFGLGSKLKRKQ
ncbi:MAG: cyanophycinase [Cyanobacteria bacterium P01_D01_bin.105]